MCVYKLYKLGNKSDCFIWDNQNFSPITLNKGIVMNPKNLRVIKAQSTQCNVHEIQSFYVIAHLWLNLIAKKVQDDWPSKTKVLLYS